LGGKTLLTPEPMFNDATIGADELHGFFCGQHYDGEFNYEGRPLQLLQGLDTGGRMVYIGTFSRTVFPALRIGYLIVPKSLAPAFTAAQVA